jgi:hypothetical protein
MGMGGVMLQSTEWQGGLRDRELVVPEQQREVVSNALQKVVTSIRETVFPIHGI